MASTLGTVVAISWLVAALIVPVRSEPVEAPLTVAGQVVEPGRADAAPAVTALVLPSTQAPATVPQPLPGARPERDPAVVAVPPAPVAVAPVPAGPPSRPTTAPTQATASRHGFGPVGRAGQLPDPMSTEQLLPDETPRRTGPAPTPVALPPTGPAPCTNAALAVTTEIDPQVHRVTERPVLRLVVTNVSAQPCLRDLDAARQEIVVWGVDGARLWSSNDCSRAAGVDLRTLVPGQPAAFAVTWAGRTSAPGCPAARTTVPVGTYNVMTRVDDVISPPVPLTRTP